MDDNWDRTIFDKELKAILETKLPVSASRITNLQALATAHPQHHNYIIQCICRFLETAPPDYRLAGLYVIDAISRSVHKKLRKREEAGDKGAPLEVEGFLKRFAIVLKSDTLIGCFEPCSTKDKDKVKKTLDIWEQSGIYSRDMVQHIKHTFMKSASPAGHDGNKGAQTKESAAPAPVIDTASLLATLSSLGSLGQTGLPGAAPASFLPFQASTASQPSQPNDPTKPIFVGDDDDDLSLATKTASTAAPPTAPVGLPPALAKLLGGLVSTPPSTHAAAAPVTSSPMVMATPPMSNVTPMSPSTMASMDPRMRADPRLGTAGDPRLRQPVVQATPPHDARQIPLGQGSESRPAWLPPQGPSVRPPQGPSVRPPQGPSIRPPQGPSIRPPQGPSIPRPSFDQRPPPPPSRPSQWNDAPPGGWAPRPGFGGGWKDQEPEPRGRNSRWNQNMPHNVPGTEPRPDDSLPEGCIRVLTRTLFVGPLPDDYDKGDVAHIFGKYGDLASIILSRKPKGKCNGFLKFVTRAAVEDAKFNSRNLVLEGVPVKVNWAYGFGPKKLFNYDVGESVIPLTQLSEEEKASLVTAPLGGFQGQPVRDQMTIEEPEVQYRPEWKKQEFNDSHRPAHHDRDRERERGWRSNRFDNDMHDAGGLNTMPNKRFGPPHGHRFRDDGPGDGMKRRRMDDEMHSPPSWDNAPPSFRPMPPADSSMNMYPGAYGMPRPSPSFPNHAQQPPFPYPSDQVQ